MATKLWFDFGRSSKTVSQTSKDKANQLKISVAPEQSCNFHKTTLHGSKMLSGSFRKRKGFLARRNMLSSWRLHTITRLYVRGLAFLVMFQRSCTSLAEFAVCDSVHIRSAWTCPVWTSSISRVKIFKGGSFCVRRNSSERSGNLFVSERSTLGTANLGRQC